MAPRAIFDNCETAERKEARDTNKRTGNYRLEPFQTNEVVDQRPSNCYGCTWTPINRGPDKGKYRLKFSHRSCYAGHIKTEK